VVEGDSDNDLIHGAGGHDRVSGFAGRDELWGDKGNDTVSGGAGRDVLFGNEGNDLLKGGSQDDVLHGGSGQDILTGGLGADKFVFASVADSTVGAADKIVDFKRRSDRIDLSLIDANTSVEGDQRFHFIASKAFSGTAGELRLPGKGNLLGDVDGDGLADFAIKVIHAARLTSRDFSL
jgi:serralysin